MNLGTNPEANPLDYRSVLTDRDRMLKKVEMPVLDGAHPYSWIARAERFFRIGQHSMQMRMDIVSLSLEDDALSWYNYEVEHRPFTYWFDFKKRMLARFAESYEKTPGKRLFGIRQTGTVAEYIREFQELATHLKVEESQLEDIFFNGLQREYQEVIKMKEHVGLPNFIAAVLLMEGSDFCKMIAGRPQNESRSSKQGQSVSFRNAAVNSSTWKTRNQNTTTDQQNQKEADKNKDQKQNNRATTPYKLSEAEYAVKRREGLCYTCDEKWFKTHKCRNMELYVIVVLNEEESNEEFHDSVEVMNERVAEVMELSLFSFFGRSSPKTTKM